MRAATTFLCGFGILATRCSPTESWVPAAQTKSRQAFTLPRATRSVSVPPSRTLGNSAAGNAFVVRSATALFADVNDSPDHTGKVAIITGASRGIGKGIALECGLAGMTVYVAGRSSRAGSVTSDRDLGDELNGDATVERTVEEIERLGGRGVPAPCDVSDDAEVAALIERVRREEGRCDLLVCSAFTTPPDLNDASFRDDFWKQGAAMWDACVDVGLRGSYVACCEAAPLMIDTAAQRSADSSDRPLMVLVSSFGGKSYTFNVAYGAGKCATDRLASDMSFQLDKYGVDTVALYPGVVRTEGNVRLEERGEWAAASGGMDLKNGESPRLSGRAVVRLLDRSTGALEQIVGGSGKVAVVAELAREMGFTDVDGRTPPSIRSLQFILPNFVFPQIEKESGKPMPDFVLNNVPDWLLPWSVFSGGPPPTVD